MSQSPPPNTGSAILLYIFAIALIVTGVVIILRGIGILTFIPGYLIWALILLTIGLGIIGGLNRLRD
jgi:hypothetical protein